jgi:CHAT domain-containing protein
MSSTLGGKSLKRRLVLVAFILVFTCNAVPAHDAYGGSARTHKLLTPLGSLSLQQPASGGSRKDYRRLASGESLRREMKGGETHGFQVSLVSGQYLHAVVEQKGIDVFLKVSGPDGNLLLEMDSPNGLQGPESVALLAQASGDYELEVRADKSLPPGAYEIRVEGIGEPTGADMNRVAATRALLEGRRLFSEGSKESRTQALEKYKESLEQWELAGDAHGKAYTLCDMAAAAGALNETEKSIEFFDRALALLKDARDDAGQAYILNEKGAVYREAGQPDKALEVYAEAIALRSRAEDSWGQAQVINNIGLIHARTGNHHKALDNYNRAQLLWQKVGDRYMEARTRNNIYGSLTELGELTQALGSLEQLLAFCREVGNPGLEAYVHNNTGKIYDTWAEPQTAHFHYEAALALFRQVGNHSGEALALDNIGMVHAAWGDTPRALEYFGESLKIRKEINDRWGEGNTLVNIGYAHALNGDHTQALKSFEKALPVSEQTGNKPFTAYAYTSAGMAHAALNQPARALEYYRLALAIQQQLADRRGQAITLDKIGQAYALSGDAVRAQESFNQALSHWSAIGDKQGIALSLYGLAGVERDRNNLVAARDKIGEAIGLVESLRTKSTDHQLRLTYFATKRDYYELDIEVRMRMYERTRSEADRNAALTASERGRARGLLDLLSEARGNIHKGTDPALVERSRRLERELSARAESLIRLRSLKRSEDAALVERDLDALVREYDSLQAKLRAGNKLYAELKQPRIISVEEIQKLLDDDTLLLEYALGDRGSYLWAVTRTTVNSYGLKKRAEIEKAAINLKDVLTAPESAAPGESNIKYLARLRQSAAQYRQHAAELSRLVLGPVAHQLGVKRLVFVADGALQFIPFESLPMPDASAARAGGALRPRAAAEGGSTKLLLSEHEVTYLPSASALALVRSLQRTPPVKSVAVFADPVFDSGDERVLAANRKATPDTAARLQFSELGRALRDVDASGGGGGLDRLRHSLDEANQIISVVPDNSGMKAVDFGANRLVATDPSLGQYRIVHFATHAILNDRHPQLSGLVLSLVNEHGQPQDGFLRLHDIFNLNLPVELVVLSACRTGIGREVKGEGLISLTRGFMYAGTPRVVASLWKVDDEATSALMKNFYRHMLQERMTPAAALKLAKIEVMQTREQWRAPFYWAGFVLQGDWK